MRRKPANQSRYVSAVCGLWVSKFINNGASPLPFGEVKRERKNEKEKERKICLNVIKFMFRPLNSSGVSN